MEMKETRLKRQCGGTPALWQHSTLAHGMMMLLWLLQESSSSGEVPHVLSDSAAAIKTPSETPMLPCCAAP